ncbi:ImmA/IrrE family metallo-endopeptidase [Georgenia halophila]|uniref:ImmA/IrrE family metallo-endopeptidase n=1 Tax=Georgenia halophila TaxID=620889 RepID=UPI0031ED01B8
MQDTEVQRLLAGDLSITVGLARRLAEVVGASATFWLTREAQYIEDRARVEADRWSQELPITQMASFGWVEKPRTWQERISVSLEFFDVGDVETWVAQYDHQVASTRYRTSPSYVLEFPATTVWFRAAERVVDTRGEIPKFDQQGFARGLHAVRHLTRQRDPEKFIPQLVSFGAEHGVHIVVVRAPSGCTASGASRTYNERPLIQLSARHLTDDHFWFTFFHEAGHVVNHALEQGFIDIFEAEDDDMFEQEANDFSTEYLLGSDGRQFRKSGPNRWSHRDVIREAVALDLAPGVLVGQLQHADVLPHSHLNRLKRRYAWNGSRLVSADIP